MSNGNTESEQSTQDRFKRGAADVGRFSAYIADFIGFTATDAANIRETRFIIEKYIPTIGIVQLHDARRPYLRGLYHVQRRRR